MEMKLTRPTQIISADVAAAVRLGLRVAFCRARVPGTPRRLGSGAPSSRLIGSATVRPRMATAKKTRTAPAQGEQHRAGRVREQPGEQGGGAQDEHAGADEHALPGSVAGAGHGGVLHGGDRRDLARLAGR